MVLLRGSGFAVPSALTLISALAMSIHPAETLAQSWVIEGVHGSFFDPIVGEENSLALDGAGRPHVAYSEQAATGYRLWYTYKGEEVWWHQEKIDGASPDVGFMVSLFLGDQGNSHVAYIAFTEWAPNFFADYLKYARKSGGVWTIEVVDSSANSAGWYPSIAVDAAGNPHVCYLDATGDDVKYARKAMGAWTIETVAPSLGYCSIVLDISGDPHITYKSYGTNDLAYAWKSGGAWTVETADGSANSVGGWSSVDLDASGNPHVGYADETTYDILFAKKSGAVWTIETVDGTGAILDQPSLALDSFGNPHLSYVDQTNDNLKYARKVGGQWGIVTVNGEPNDNPQRNSLALDGFENPHVMYHEWNRDTLKYAHVPPPTGIGSETFAGLAGGRALVVAPNPALNGALRVLYRVAVGSRETDLAVYDVSGRRIRALVSGSAPAGPAVAAWDGSDDDARRVPAGVYLVRLVEGGVPRDVARITLIR